MYLAYHLHYASPGTQVTCHYRVLSAGDFATADAVSCFFWYNNSEVRRAALYQLDVHPTSLPYILSRTRDVDPIIRRFIYSHALAELPSMNILTREQRNTIVKSGLRDREDSVKKAAAKLIGTWAGKLESGLTGVG